MSGSQLAELREYVQNPPFSCSKPSLRRDQRMTRTMVGPIASRFW